GDPERQEQHRDGLATPPGLGTGFECRQPTRVEPDGRARARGTTGRRVASRPFARAFPRCLHASIVTDARAPQTRRRTESSRPVVQGADRALTCAFAVLGTVRRQRRAEFFGSACEPRDPDVRLPLHLVVTPLWFSTCSPHGPRGDPTEKRWSSTG